MAKRKDATVGEYLTAIRNGAGTDGELAVILNLPKHKVHTSLQAMQGLGLVVSIDGRYHDGASAPCPF